jgi:hypothetical protein
MMDLRETSCADGRRTELIQDCIQSQTLVLAALNLRVLLAQCKDKGKGNVKPLCLTKHHAMKVYWGVEVQLHALAALMSL